MPRTFRFERDGGVVFQKYGMTSIRPRAVIDRLKDVA